MTLIERLRDMQSKKYRSDWWHFVQKHCSEAANRIEALEAEVLEQCRINGIGAERELALLAENERLRLRLDSADEQSEQLASVLAEAKALREDAERLDWLYSGAKTESDAMISIELRLLNGESLSGTEVRAAIDAARDQS